MTSHYQPESGSLADRVCAFFRANPEEEMSNADIAQKYDVPRTSVSSSLAAARANGLLRFDRGAAEDGGNAWRAGPKLPPLGEVAVPHQQPAGPGAKAPPPAHKPIVRKHLPPLDADALEVRSSVLPLVKGNKHTGTTKYDQVLDRLQAVGQSVLLPAQYQDAVTKALKAYGKRTQRKFTVRSIDAQHCGIWRTA